LDDNNFTEVNFKSLHNLDSTNFRVWGC